MPRKSVKRSRSKLSNQMRAKIEAAIESLMAILDEADPDPDLEDNADDEPWLGSPPWPAGKYALDAEHDPSEEENSLGATHATNQVHAWRGGNWMSNCDREFDGETAPSADTEPSLGSTICDQRQWAQSGRDDRELDDDFERDPAENGIGDQDGLEEQVGRAH